MTVPNRMVESEDRTSIDRRSIRAILILFALLAIPIAAFITGNSYGSPDIESPPPALLPRTAFDVENMSIIFLAMLVLGAIVSGILTLILVRFSRHTGAWAHRMTAGFSMINIIVALGALALLAYIAGYYVGALSPVPERSCLPSFAGIM